MYLNHIGPPLRPQGPVLVIVKMDVPRPGPLRVRLHCPPLFFISLMMIIRQTGSPPDSWEWVVGT